MNPLPAHCARSLAAASEVTELLLSEGIDGDVHVLSNMGVFKDDLLIGLQHLRPGRPAVGFAHVHGYGCDARPLCLA